MNFSQFLKMISQKKCCSSVNELFKFLGGEEELNMSLRNFQLIESGRQIPTLKAFSLIFEKLDREDYKQSLISFLECHLDSNHQLLNYINEHLTSAYNKTEKSVWDIKKDQMTYSERQMSFLAKNLDALKLHHRLLLWEHIPNSQISDKIDIAKELVSEGLATLKPDGLHTIRALIRTPNYENHSPSSVRKASQMLLSHFDAYLSEEGSPKQEMGYAIQRVDQNSANTILAEMKKFKKWVQSMASPKNDPSLVPFVMITFGKILEKKELS